MVQRGKRSWNIYWLVGSLYFRVCNIIETNKQPKMIEIIPYFAALITILFGVAFILALNRFRGENEN
jgi:hypothetical protein